MSRGDSRPRLSTQAKLVSDCNSVEPSQPCVLTLDRYDFTTRKRSFAPLNSRGRLSPRDSSKYSLVTNG